MQNQTNNSSSSDDVPIPSAPFLGRSTRIEKIKNKLSVYNISVYMGKHSTAFVMLSLLLPSFLSSPALVLAISDVPGEQITETTPANIYAAITPSHWDPTLTAILENEVARHSITNPNWADNVETYIAMIKHIESDGKRAAYNPSGAMSYFQFKAASLETAYNRLLNYMQRYGLGRTPGWSKNLKTNPDSIYNTSSNRQALFMIVNIIEQDKRTGYFADFLAGDSYAGVDAYYRYHHTNPDQFTINRTEKLYKQYFTQ